MGGSGEGSKEHLNAMSYNNAYVDGRWSLFRNAGAMSLITRKASLAGVKIPASPIEPTCKACPKFHIKAMCNTGFRNVADHVPHTREQDWAVQSMTEIAAHAAPIA